MENSSKKEQLELIKKGANMDIDLILEAVKKSLTVKKQVCAKILQSNDISVMCEGVRVLHLLNEDLKKVMGV